MKCENNTVTEQHEASRETPSLHSLIIAPPRLRHVTEDEIWRDFRRRSASTLRCSNASTTVVIKCLKEEYRVIVSKGVHRLETCNGCQLERTGLS